MGFLNAVYENIRKNAPGILLYAVGIGLLAYASYVGYKNAKYSPPHSSSVISSSYSLERR